MGSFKPNKRNQGPDRRRGANGQRFRDFFKFDQLEERTLLDGSGPVPWFPSSSDIADVKNGPMANAGVELIKVYQAYQNFGGDGSRVAQAFPQIRITGNSVGVDVKGTGDFNQFLSSLQTAGMQVTATDPSRSIAEGLLPISALLTVSTSTQTVGLAPIGTPTTSYQGQANNQAETTLNANVARQQFGVNGAGVTVGVLSDSANQLGNGLADSVSTGDLPSGVRILEDGPAGSSDEGRAMLENIYDIAPGASLAFATAWNGEVGFATNIRRLANEAGAKVIVDDIGYRMEPMFQDGLISQAIIDVTQQRGVSYFSAAGNSADLGYLSQFRGVNATPGSLPAGRYMNFNGNGGTATLLPITTNSRLDPNAGLNFQFDQPWYTTNGVTSDLDIYVLDASGNVVASGTSNNIATRSPYEFVSLATLQPNTTYFVAIRVTSGADPGYVQIGDWFDSISSISKQFGSAGGTYYPTTFGHPTSSSAIGVGAVPWWGTNPTNTPPPNPVRSEPFSSYGPAIIKYNSLGIPFPSPQLRQTPVISAPDGGNTTFFGSVIDTSRPGVGQPSTPTNLSQNLPSFFGTSSAAPNAAAVAALMLQRAPTSTPTDIRNAMIASASPLNGASTGQWDVQGGFGMIDSVKAVSLVGGLQVLSTTPANRESVTQAPRQILVTFNSAVDINSITSANLVFTFLPLNVGVTVGRPFGVDDPQHPTTVAFPINIQSGLGLVAYGDFTYVIQGGIVSAEGKPLTESKTSVFNLNDTTGPRILNTTMNGRVITVQFSEAVRPETINAANFVLARAGSSGVFGNPSNVNLSADPRLKITYDASTNTATLDYSALDQAQFPTDQYVLIVTAGDNGSTGVRDLAGNFLDGFFNGVFPSGNGSNPNFERRFSQFYGTKNLIAPVVTSLQLKDLSDSGIKGDRNTNAIQPVFIGQVGAGFPGTVAGLTVVAQFDGYAPIAPGQQLNPGGGNRGFTGRVDVTAVTDANGSFVIQPPGGLLQGYNTVRVVVIGQPDSPPLPGLSSVYSSSFRVDRTGPIVFSASLTPGGNSLPLVSTGIPISNLSSISLNVLDEMNPPTGSLATPPQVLYSALDPVTATNISNYSLINVDTGFDASNYIESAKYVSTDSVTFTGNPGRTSTSDPYAGRIDLTFRSGLPAGTYELVAHSSGSSGGKNYAGIKDAAGNDLDNTNHTGSVDFKIKLQVQNQSTYLTNVQALRDYTGSSSQVIGGPRSYFELPAAGQMPRAEAPPGAFVFDFSNPLAARDYTGVIQLVGSLNPGAGNVSDGDFGTLGIAGQGTSGTGFTVINTTIKLVNKATGRVYDPANPPAPGENVAWDRLVLEIPSTLAADHYRLYMPNTDGNSIFDIYGNKLDGEFLGTPSETGSYETLLPNGQYRVGMTGDGVGGGAFVTGFVVVPNGNVVFAKPDYIEDPLSPSTMPDGSRERPYAALAPEVNPLNVPSNPSFDPNGGANGTDNFFNFNSQFDRNGDGKFTRSALYAAEQLSRRGPVVVVALPGTPTFDPVTGKTIQQTFVLQAPAGPSTTINDGSASVPFNTTLVFNPGSALKLQNASLYVQNQGSALQLLGGANPNDRVNITSWADATVGGKTNGTFGRDTPAPGDWGGIILRNFDNVSNGRNVSFPIDGGLHGVGNSRAISGADDALTFFNFANVRYAGGAVPQTQGQPASAITLYNSRPTIANATIAFAGSRGSNLIASISADFDSFREDDTARGPLLRRVITSSNSLNGILVRADSTGAVQQSDAILYPDNPSILGGTRNFTFDDPLPHILVSQLLVGQQLLQNTGGQTEFVGSRLYIQPGMMVKSQRGAGIAVVSHEASMNIGSRTYIDAFDLDHNYAPINADGTTNTNFKASSASDAKVLFTSLYDNTATTSYFDPVTQQTTIIVPAIDSGNSGGANQPTPGNVPALARWGSVSYQSGAVGIVNRAEFRYGGGLVNGPEVSVPNQSVLAFITSDTPLSTPLNSGGFNPGGVRLDELGTKVMVTNNDFYDNLDTPMQIEPNGLLAGDPLRPLLSGHPYFRGNVMKGNDIDGLAVVTSNVFQVVTDPNQPIRRIERPFGAGGYNQSVNAVWDATDLTYVVRGSVVLAGDYEPGKVAPVPDATGFVAQRKPQITLTVQSNLPDTLLPDGTRIGRPGESALVKLMSDFQSWAPGVDSSARPFGPVGASAGNSAATNVGAGFAVGGDDGVDPPTPFTQALEAGVGSQIRFVGIPGNEATGQQRVPVILTSLRDGTVGKSVRGVDMFNIYNRYNGDPNRNLTTPAPGDGGNILFGANSLTDYNLFDPRDGNIIDNADIRYMSRIEIQGGGIVDTDASSGSFQQQKLGLTPLTQFNSASAMTISNSNLAYFSDAAVFVHSRNLNAMVRDVSSLANPGGPGFVGRPVRDTTNNQRGQGVVLFMYGNTISNSSVGIEAYSDQGSPPRASQNPNTLVLMHNTFYNNPTALHTVGFGPSDAQYNHVYWLAINNIFANSSVAAINAESYANGSQAQYNLFWQNAVNIQSGGIGFLGNTGAIIGDPDFLDPASLNFQLGPNSAAIDASRSEIGPLAAGDAIFPTVTQIVNQTAQGPVPTSVSVRTDPNSLTFPATPGRVNPNGGQANIQDPRKLVLLPGRGYENRKFFDQWVPTLTTDPSGVSGPSSNPGTFNYKPVSGVLDALGFQRLDDPTRPDTGFGSNTSIDIGAYERRVFDPPKVTAVTAKIDPNPSVPPVNFYNAGGSSGTNKTPYTIDFVMNHALDPSTVTNRSVLLQASGGDGIFGNGNSSADTFIDLSGKLEFNPSTSILTVHLADLGVVLSDDAYRIFLLGNGSDVIRDPQGNALDGENTANNDPNNPTLPLPSGDGIPSGNFVLKFTVNSQSAQIAPNTFALSTPSDSNARDYITYNNVPTFTGSITVNQPAINPVQGQLVVLDISTKSDGVFDRMNVGTALTNALGDFAITVGVDGANSGLVTNTSPLPDSSYSVGPDGILRSILNTFLNANLSGDDRNYSTARVRVINGGNSSDLTPASYTGFVVDTTGPKVTSMSPTQGTLLTPDASNRVTFTFTSDKNLDPSSLNVNTLLVTTAGPDQQFGTPDDVQVPIDWQGIGVTPISTGGKGAERISFSVLGSNLENNLYRVILKGTGTETIRDIAGNPLGGATGAGGVDFTSDYVVYNPGLAHTLYVGASSYVTDASADVGTRNNPYSTIALAMADAVQGDVVAVLPGLYTENVVMKSLVKLLSADRSSTATNFVRGNPLNTVLRAPSALSGIVGATNTTVTATNIFSILGLNTEISGFTIASPLLGDPVLGSIDLGSVGLRISNSNLLVTQNYFVSSGFGIAIETSGTNAVTPRIENNGIIGNATGLLINDINGSTSLPQGNYARINNNTFAFNTYGVLADVKASSPLIAQFANNIFWQNNDRSAARVGAAVYATVANKLVLRNNLFSANGSDSATQGRYAGFNIGNGFDRNNLSTSPTTDPLGNYLGDPAFVSPRDPRSGGDGLAAFFNDASFSLTSRSAAIDGANNAIAPPTDFLSRGRVKIEGRGWPNTGPADVGAFEFSGTGGVSAGGAFRVVTTSIAPGGASKASGTTFSQGPNSIIVDFSSHVDRNTVTPNDLILSGNGLDGVSPARAASLTWIDEHTVRFNLTGGYKPSGTVNVAIAPGAVRGLYGESSLAFSDAFKLAQPQIRAASTNTTQPSATPEVNTVVAPIVATPVATPTPNGPVNRLKARYARILARRLGR